ncbi:N-acetyl-1-D-myo-inositol-2-amino-2-deoxy-alpha-D-glucopyranoside deacetylase [Phytoactinopolyspora alkaliphila]|uniref:1D-myo-inositol 2-acetamido-2-deoxy-alpha-D-glucopyranoside deacetylase n=1 Tax=Phytoactinopolyspora alkaliphila TaxID=1783498 RepID=A0A6N9YSW9_9ACTN|nr:N-acetyl-1-D-myo-inositol-2-amino-2-deoxy-alpha-D-glucopyranoside deacetylase [Phytoactinopolyspora alkaliphila]NED98072.1 N-acetyl-1-D-myo-inositol-2-amino-2-deoxy-alpha-D-glucopyranoside deacetylase [Phytoactinopolyspora alkaliphila]
MAIQDSQRRLLLVHAHPDDETIGTGATMARYAAEGAHVTLVTCTRGEQGEILVPELAHLAPEQEDGLGEHRVKELAVAMAELGVSDYRFLGGPGRYRDSGMVWGEEGRRAETPDSVRPDSFWAADLREASDHLVEVIREVRPQVMITYDENGGYGHPDHIQAHRVATYALNLAGVPSYRQELGVAWKVPKLYWTAMPRSVIQQSIDALKDTPDNPFGTVQSADDFGFVVDDADVTAVVDGTEWVDRKMAAMRAHRTQIDVEGGFFALSDQVGQSIWSTEHYRLAHGLPGPVDPETGIESDLFSGL